MVGNSSNNDKIIREALDHYANVRHWWLIPCWGLTPARVCCCPKGLACKNPGKHPREEHKHRTARDAYKPRPYTLDDLELARARHLRQFGAEPNWAVHLGRSGLTCLDIDRHKPEADGVANLAALVAQHGPLPDTLCDNRGHYFFKAPADSDRWYVKHILPGVEFKAGPSLVHVFPSAHYKGGQYVFGDQPAVAVELPAWLESWARQAWAPPPPRPMGEVRREAVNLDTLHARVRAYVATVPGGTDGVDRRQQTLYTAWQLTHGWGLSAADAWPHFQRWNDTCSPPRDERALRKFLEEADRKGGQRGWLLDDDRNRDPHTVQGMRIGSGEFPMKLRRPPVPTAVPPAEDLGQEPSARLVAELAAEEAEHQVAARAASVMAAEHRAEHRPEATTCHCHGFLYHPERNRVRVARFSCGCWSCLNCSKRLKRIWAPHLQLKITTVPDPQSPRGVDPPLTQPRTDPVYLGDIPAAAWPNIRRSLHRAGADFVRVTSADRLTLTVCATAPFAGGAEMPPTEAAELVVAIVEAILIFGDTRKPIHTSKGWRLPRPKPSGWRYVAPVEKAATRQQIVEAVEAECGEVRTRRMPFPFFIWAAEAPAPFDPGRLAEEGWGQLARELHERIELQLLGIPVAGPEMPLRLTQ